MVRTIPLHVLIHEVTYEEYAGDDGWGESYKPAVTLKNVLIQPISNITRSNIAEQKNYKAILFFDMTHSMPKVTFKEKSKVTFNGQTMTVQEVNTLYAFSTVPHHIEVTLI
jgi:hypothetical protein